MNQQELAKMRQSTGSLEQELQCVKNQLQELALSQFKQNKQDSDRNASDPSQESSDTLLKLREELYNDMQTQNRLLQDSIQQNKSKIDSLESDKQRQEKQNVELCSALKLTRQQLDDKN